MTQEHNNVTRPAHYARASVEPIQLIDALELGYYEGNVVKYVCRHTHKNGLEDLEKAAWYLDRLIAKAKGEERYPAIPTECTAGGTVSIDLAAFRAYARGELDVYPGDWFEDAALLAEEVGRLRQLLSNAPEFEHA